MQKTIGRISAMVAVLSACIALVPGVAMADLWVSGSGTDSGYCSQANPCATISRAVSLAIPNDTICIGPGSYKEHVVIPSTKPGDPNSISGLTLQGAGMHSTTVTGGGFDTPGSVFSIGAGNTVTIADMTITLGVAPAGGGVVNAGLLTLERTDITQNVAQGTPAGTPAQGGGVYSFNGNVTLADSVVEANLAAQAGGGVWMYNGTVTRSLIDSNLVSSSSVYAGGGVFLVNGAVSMDTIVNNSVVDGAGRPAGVGGGVFAPDDNDAEAISDTVVGNTAGEDGGVGGFQLRVLDSILAANPGGDCDPSTEFAGHDVDVDGTCSGRSTGNIVGVDPKLGPLTDNGGPTKTMAIHTSSPAYDANPNDCSGTDQRGVSLLQRGATSCDIGAYQVSAPTTYVANPAANSVTAYADGASGDAAPVLTLSGLATGLSQPSGVIADVSGDVLVTNAAANSITEYAPELTGNAAPTATITGSLTRLNRPQDLALDASGHLYVTNSGGSVTEYAPGAHGNAAPVARVTGSRTHLVTPSGIVIDPDGNVRVTDSGSVLTFTPGATGNVAPLHQLKYSALKTPHGLNFDAAGGMLVAAAGTHEALTFAPGATGTVQPVSTLKGASPGLKAPTGLDLDVSGDLFVADTAANSVFEFPSTATGQARSLATIAGADTGLSSPAFLSELPPTPAPRLRVSVLRHQSRKRILANGVMLRISASRSMAFRGQAVPISAVARLGRSLIASAAATPLRPGRMTLHLQTSRRADVRLRRRHRQFITVAITVGGDAGIQHQRLTIICTG
jgi:sugar lactone lactonase YvrE